ncbi:GNAT family N-acetyltransferase [Tsuneonella troitsensis]|uniref:GNAT family N-acetyltransferase n=1 Tax=Tsuneonella troitsensis TaxID=292222 RepID=UPI00070E326B|nr:GNAT family N-acetyltransferase [Tsuneonella troitsensis]
MTGVEVRSAKVADAPAVAAIYAHHFRHGTASFDTVPPALVEWEAKISAILAKSWPFLVAELSGVVVGYAYAAQFRDRPAYAHTCEDSIYVSAEYLGQGVGSKLISALVEAAKICGFEQMIAVAGGAEPASVALHAKAGFVEAGRMRRVGRKFGKVLDTLYMQRDLTR